MTRARNNLLLLCLVLGVAILATGAASETPRTYSTDVAIKPGTQTGAFVLRAQVKDLSSGDILAGPIVKVPAGQAANTETTLEDGTVVSLSAKIEGDKHAATYTVTVKRGDKIVSEHSANVAL